MLFSIQFTPPSMDTLFRLVSLQSSDQHHHQQQQQHSNSSFNSSRSTSTSSKSSNKLVHYHHQYHHNHHNNINQPQAQYNYSSSYNYYLRQDQAEGEDLDQEECCNNHHLIYMDEDHFSSSSNPNNPNPNITPSPYSGSAASDYFSLPQNLNLNLDSSAATSSTAPGGSRWASDLLIECARSVANRDTPRVQQLMWMLNELSSPYGDTDQKLASYFLQALFAKLTSSGPRTLRTLASASDQTTSFESTRRTALRFQELSPWSSFGHVAANGAILESFLETAASPQRLHILDLSNTFCTQWPTLLEALATRSADDTPHLTITTVVNSPSSSSTVQRVMKEIGARMDKFGRLMGVPFKFNIVHHSGDLSNLDLDRLDLSGEEALAINCINSLHRVSPSGSRRDDFISTLRRLQPRIVTVVEEEADLDGSGGGGGDDDEGLFLKGFKESLRFFGAYFESLEESFPKTSNERLALERAVGRAVIDLVACPLSESTERRDTASGWSRRMRSAGFTHATFSDDVADDVRALLRRYKEGWSMRTDEGSVDPAAGIFLAWKEQPAVWASAWKM